MHLMLMIGRLGATVTSNGLSTAVSEGTSWVISLVPERIVVVFA